MASASVRSNFIHEFERGLSDQLAAEHAIADQLPPWAHVLFTPSRYKVLYGGRGSGKSYAVADALLELGRRSRIRVLCSRELQISIKESVHFLLTQRIEAHGLDDFYEIFIDQIRGANGTQFIFKGIRHNVNSIKSMAGVTHCWVEEAQSISAESWRVLVPTIREPGSEIWVTFNPLNRDDVIYREFVERDRPGSIVRRINWSDNPYFPSVLDEERRMMQALDPDAYAHIWEGYCWERSNAQILHGKWVVQEFDVNPRWDGPYHGIDFGFSQDPTTMVRVWVGDRCLWVEHESYARQLELDNTAAQWAQDVPGHADYVSRADSARPESISYLARHGVPNIRSAPKWSGSVMDGIAHLRQYDRIVIHPRCTHTAEEARLWRYKTDPASGDPLPIILPGHDHCMDAIRYALAPLILNRTAPIEYKSSGKGFAGDRAFGSSSTFGGFV